MSSKNPAANNNNNNDHAMTKSKQLPVIAKLDQTTTNDYLKTFNETLKQEFSEQKAGIRSILKEIVAYEKVQNLNLHQWTELESTETKEHDRLAKCEHIVTKSMMEVDLEAHGL